MSSQSGFNVLTNQSQSARTNVKLSASIRSEVNAISPQVDRVMALIRKCQCVPRRRHEVELVLREALANAVLHGNRQDTGKKVYVCYSEFLPTNRFGTKVR
jgi:anti-sigma regulatory factor (Ser/Thr protein kinase)